MATTNNFLEQYIPNYNRLLNTATENIGNLMSGTPSPSTVRNAAATFGAENGLGTGSGVVNRYGYDLYNQEGEKRQAQGLQEFQGLVPTVAGPLLSNQGQNLQNQQFYAGQNQQAQEFNANEDLQQLEDMIRSYSSLL